jgi:hypothetical protein
VKSLMSRRPSPALVIACIALFVSLGGVSYGVATGFIDSREIKNNEIRSGDLRNNEIRTRDLRNNEVRGIDVRNSTIQSRDIAINGVQGVDVREDTLAKVPSAAAADLAGAATTAQSVDDLRVIAPVTLAKGAASVTLATHGPLTVALRCFPEGGGTTAEVTVDSSADDATALGEGTTGENDLDAADPAASVIAVGDQAGAPRSAFSSGLVASVPGGQALSGQLSVIADEDAAVCSAQGHLVLAG